MKEKRWKFAQGNGEIHGKYNWNFGIKEIPREHPKEMEKFMENIAENMVKKISREH